MYAIVLLAYHFITSEINSMHMCHITWIQPYASVPVSGELAIDCMTLGTSCQKSDIRATIA